MKGTHVLHWIRCATDKKVPCPREYSRADVHRRHCQYGDLDPAVSSVWDTEFPPISEAMVSIFLSLSLSHSPPPTVLTFHSVESRKLIILVNVSSRHPGGYQLPWNNRHPPPSPLSSSQDSKVNSTLVYIVDRIFLGANTRLKSLVSIVLANLSIEYPD